MRTLDRKSGRTIFGAGAQGYHALRAGYPQELFDHLRERVSKPAPAILEIGPGSGLATQGLLTLDPSRLVAVESDPDFAAWLTAHFQGAPVEIVNAPFPCEGITGPFDLAACAAAFHWLEPDTALAALRRLLRPGGIWAMWWNVYLDYGRRADGSYDPFSLAAMDIVREAEVPLPPSFAPHGHEALDAAKQTALLSGAGFGDIEHRLWQSEQTRSTAEVRGLFDSFSFIRHLPEPRRTHVLDRIAKLVDERFGGAAPCTVVTSCFTARN